MPLAGLVVTQNKIDANRHQVKRMVKATLKGLMLVHQNRQEAIDIATAWMTVDPQFSKKVSLKRNVSPLRLCMRITFQITVKVSSPPVRVGSVMHIPSRLLVFLGLP
jgi:uncharacterized pyridoxal phosphate-containing UPF0001 family protein